MTPAPGNRETALMLVGVVLTMASLSFAAVPFYDWFCKVTGFGGTTSVAEAASEQVLDKTITVRFDASLEAGMPWDFKPEVRQMTLKIGENGLAFFEAHNPTNRPVAGTASYNVFPYSAGGYFTKIACFCFEMQVLQPGETVQMPVSFYVDPAIVDDPEGKYVSEITLSYTFHETELPEEQAALAPVKAGAVN
jgi:cytochrome c oxidase assembly protein subunit 11